jgi:hypothetical protein
VSVDDRGQVAELVASRDLHRLPDHAFLDLAVTEQYPGVKVLLGQPSPERYADSERQALAQ